MNIGQKVISFYFILVYLFPMLGNIIFKNNITSTYKICPLTFTGLLCISSVFFLYYYYSKRHSFNFSSNRLIRSSVIQKIAFFGTKYAHYRFLVAVSVFIFSIFYFSFGLSSYRYGFSSILELNSNMLLIGIIIENILLIDLFYFLFINPNNRIVGIKYTYFSNVIIALSLLLLANGTHAAFLALIMIFASVMPKKFHSILFPGGSLTLKKRIGNFIIHGMIFLLIVVLAWNHGEAIKTASLEQTPMALLESTFDNWSGKAFKSTFLKKAPTANPQNQDTTLPSPSNISNSAVWSVPTSSETTPDAKTVSHTQQIQPVASTITTTNPVLSKEKPSTPITERIGSFFNHLFSLVCFFIERSSVYYYSFLYTHSADIDVGTPILAPIKTMLFRMDHLLFRGFFEIQRPQISSMCVLNYHLLAKSATLNRAGSSPGLIASFKYIFPFPLNILFCVFYLITISSLINNLFSKQSANISIFGVFITFLLFEKFFQSPFDLLIIFDTTLLHILLLLSISLVHHKYTRRSAISATLEEASAIV